MSKPVGVFLFNGFQEMEFWYPVLRLREAGANVTVIGVDGADAAASILGYPVVPNAAMSTVSPGDFGALVVPGGNVSGLAENASFREFLHDAAKKRVRIFAASQASSLVPAASDSALARTTDDVPQWTRTLVKELDL